MRCVVRGGDIIWDEKINKREQNERKKPLSRADIGLAGLAVEVEETRGRANEVGGWRGGRWRVGKASSSEGGILLKSLQASIMGRPAWPQHPGRRACTLPRSAALRI